MRRARVGHGQGAGGARRRPQARAASCRPPSGPPASPDPPGPAAGDRPGLLPPPVSRAPRAAHPGGAAAPAPPLRPPPVPLPRRPPPHPAPVALRRRPRGRRAAPARPRRRLLRRPSLQRRGSARTQCPAAPAPRPPPRHPRPPRGRPRPAVQATRPVAEPAPPQAGPRRRVAPAVPAIGSTHVAAPRGGRACCRAGHRRLRHCVRRRPLRRPGLPRRPLPLCHRRQGQGRQVVPAQPSSATGAAHRRRQVLQGRGLVPAQHLPGHAHLGRQARQTPFSRDQGRHRVDLRGLDPGDIDRIVIRWPSASLAE